MNPLHNVANMMTYVPMPNDLMFYWHALKNRYKEPHEFVLTKTAIFARCKRTADFGCVFAVGSDGVTRGHGGNTIPYEIPPDQFHKEVIPHAIETQNYNPPLAAHTEIVGFVPIGQQPDEVIVLTA